MANVLMEFKGTYRLKAPYDLETYDFPRRPDGGYEDCDVYIDCENGVKIFAYSDEILEAYIPSIQCGRNIIKNIYRDYINESNTITSVSEVDIERNGKVIHVLKEYISIINDDMFCKDLKNNMYLFSIAETDKEIMFRFDLKDLNKFAMYLNPKTSGSNISPFSKKNLPKNKYNIPDEDLIKYKVLIEKLPQNDLILLSKVPKDFLKSIATKESTYEWLKLDMKKKGYKQKEYIHSIGMWDRYIEYIKMRLKEL